MTLLRNIAPLALALAVAGAMLPAGTVRAADVSMAEGSVNFSTPESWLGIMETEGDPESRVFQVPDPSPSGHNTLARVSVTVKQVADVNGFQQYMGDATAKAMALPGYRAAPVPPAPNSYAYVARENGAQFSYAEHYWLKDGHAIQLRCVRPAQSDAGSAWTAAFDRGCNAIAAKLKS